MRSARSFFGSVVLLLALPAAVVLQALFAIEAEMVFHFELTLGFALLSSGDFNTPTWIKILGKAITIFLSLTFLIQGLAQFTGNEFLNWLGFQTLGQWPESLFVDLLLIWFVGLLFTDSAGKTRILGFICVASAVAVKASGYVLFALGSSLEEQFAALKILLLLPFVWLLVESKKSKKAI